MKKFVFIFGALACFAFSSCLEVVEEVQINDNDSGYHSITMDMAQLIDMMAAMGGEEFEKKKDEKVDTVIYLRNMQEIKLSDEYRELSKDGKMSVKMDLAATEFKINLHNSFSSLGNLEKLSNSFSKSGSMLNAALAGTMGGEKGSPETPGIETLLGVFDYEIGKNKIRRTVNKNRLQAMKDDIKLKEMQEGASMGIEVKYTMKYKLPRAAKKVSNDAAVLSDDKKTVSLTKNLMDIFEKPDVFEFSIDY